MGGAVKKVVKTVSKAVGIAPKAAAAVSPVAAVMTAKKAEPAKAVMGAVTKAGADKTQLTKNTLAGAPSGGASLMRDRLKQKRQTLG